MKKKTIYIQAIILSLGLASCGEDFLDKTDPTVVVSSTFYENDQEVEQAVIGIYGMLRGYFNNHWQYTEFISDNTTLHFNVGNRGQGPALEALEYWQYNAGTPNFASLYNNTYNILVNVNTTLENLKSSTASQAIKDRSEGELKVIRAYLYFDLVRLFGDVIIVTAPIKTPSEAFQLVRSPQEQVYSLIISDLNEAANLLPSSYPASQVGRITKGAAHGILGRVRLQRKEYAEAVNILKPILSLGYELLPNYADVFKPENKNHKESIWDVQYQGENTFGVNSSFIYTFAPLASQGAVIKFPGQDGGGWNIPSNEIIALYEAGDARKDVSLKEGYTANNGTWEPVPFINKYNNPHSIRGVTNDNWPILRYSDVLLMLAEAINEQGGPNSESYDYLNSVRIRAKLAPLNGLDQAQFRAAVMKERRIELAFENHRWFDLKRTLTPSELKTVLNKHGQGERAKPTTSRGGIPFSADDYTFEEYQVLFPIPADQIRINPATQQNPGY
ncbi:MAG TPA: RagB/SusD family nutrient uptake outer membrane protein [Algoriphagus sp.]|nr:RagB/SusD family nutrient uptake outer membrane protein [Algoriphagus sp.]